MTLLKYSSISFHKLPRKRGFLKGPYRYKNRLYFWKYPKYSINVQNIESIEARKYLLKQLIFLFYLTLQKLHLRKNIFPFLDLPQNIINQIILHS